MSARVGRESEGRQSAEPLDVLIVLNPVAAKTESSEIQKTLVEAVSSRGLRHRVVVTEAGDESRITVEQAIGQAIEGGCRRVVAVGGDGTVAMTASHLTGSGSQGRAVLSIVPTGTANILARELGIPLSLDAAVLLALDGDRTIELDAIQAADRPVFTQVGIGLDAKMIRDTSREDQISSGRLAYVKTFLRRAMGHRPADFTLTIDGKSVRIRAYQIVVANVGVLGAPPFTWGPGIDPSDGAIDVCVYAARTVKDYLTLVQRLLTGHHRRDAHTRYFRAEKRVVISSRPPMLVQGDGEILGRTPVTLDVIPKALSICVPKNIDDLESAPGAPMDPAPTQAKGAKGATAGHQPLVDPSATLSEDVDTMVAQHSRTWVLQGWPRHPFAFLAALDTALYMRINAMQFGAACDRGFVLLSNVMHYGEGWAMVALAMLIADFRMMYRGVIEALIVLWATMLSVNFPLKRVFRRRRPFVAFVKARVLGPRPKDFSLPSGHTAAAFAGALLFGMLAPAWAPLFYAIALVVGFSRIYLGVHYPSDVLLGAIVGTFLSGFYLALLRMVLPHWG